VAEALKRANSKTEYTSENVSELLKCSDDYQYCIDTYFKTRHPTRGEVPFKTYDYQKRLLKSYVENDKTIVLAPRQCGKSETSAAYLLCEAIFKPNQTILICSNNMNGATEIVERISFMYGSLPHWMVPGISVNNKTSLTFDNGSRIISRATTKNSGRGLSISCVSGPTLITVRNKHTGEIKLVEFEKFATELINKI